MRRRVQGEHTPPPSPHQSRKSLKHTLSYHSLFYQPTFKLAGKTRTAVRASKRRPAKTGTRADRENPKEDPQPRPANLPSDSPNDESDSAEGLMTNSSAEKMVVEDGNEEMTENQASDEDREINFADLKGVGEHSDSSDDDGPLETLAISKLPSQLIELARNDEQALEKKLSDIAIFHGSSGLPFRESLEIVMPLTKKLPDELAMDDIQREKKIAELTTAAVHIGLERLRKMKVKFRRPDDYFAEMVKTDHQMSKVKARIMHEKEKIDAAEKRRNNREILKNKKKLRGQQLEQQQEKKRKAKEEIEAFKRLRKQRLKDREQGNVSDDDDEFPIDLLEVEQLDSENRFQRQKDIASGKKTAWRPDAKNGQGAKKGKKIKSKRPGKDARKRKRAVEPGAQKFGKPTGGQSGGKRGNQRGGNLKAAGGIKKRRR